MSDGKEWLHDHHQVDDDDDSCSVDSNDTLQNFIQFTSHRNETGLEEAISVTYPFPESEEISTSISTSTLRISTLLEEEDLVPLFDGAGWAGTRVWAAAIWGIKYLVENYSGMNLCELGCGLGVPGMVWHQLGNDVVLTDQESIMAQMVENTRSNFKETFVDTKNILDGDGTSENGELADSACASSEIQLGKIYAEPLTWSRDGFHRLLETTGFKNGFDIVLNCDCVYEPLYGKSWELLVEVIDECLKVNPKCLVVTSVERRNGDEIDLFLAKMESMEHVASVVKVMEDKEKDLELYITRGRG